MNYLPSIGMGGFSLFNPASIAGMKLWLDAAFGVTQSGGLVSQILDKSGTANHANSSGSNRPGFTSNSVNGLPGIAFNAGVTLMDGTGVTDGTTQYTVFAVCKATGASGGQVLELRNAGSNFHHLSQRLLSQYISGDSAADEAVSGLSSVAGIPQVLQWSFNGNGTLSKFLLNGVSQTISGGTLSSLAGTNGYRLGNRQNTASSQGYIGDINEVIVYDTELSSGNATPVRLWLGSKYAISTV